MRAPRNPGDLASPNAQSPSSPMLLQTPAASHPYAVNRELTLSLSPRSTS